MTDTMSQIEDALALAELIDVLDELNDRDYQVSYLLAKQKEIVSTIRALAALSRPAPDVPGAEEVEAIGLRPINTNDLRDMASEFRGTTFTEMVIEAAHQLDHARTDRNILQAQLDATRAELAGVKPVEMLFRPVSLTSPDLVFVEAEDGNGNSINIGEWSLRDGYYVLKFAAALAKDAPT